MALFTWGDVQNEAKRRGVNLGARSLADQRLLQSDPDRAMQAVGIWADWDNSSLEKQALDHQWMENWRKSAGYSGGAEGMDYNVLNRSGSFGTPSGGSFGGGTPSTQQRREQLYSETFDRPAFSYDYETDPVWQSYAKAYNREGRRAGENAMAEAAAMTGGAPSSYAVTAGQQAGNYYASQLADKVPELEQLAYNRWLNDYRQRAALEELLYQREQDDYKKRLAAAEAQAKAGDWSGYAPLYGQDWAERMTALNSVYGYAPDGGTYQIGSAKGQQFLANAAPGQTMTGGDGSVWTRNADGTVTIAKDGKVYTVGQAMTVSGGRTPKTEGSKSAEKLPLPGDWADVRRSIDGMLQTGQHDRAKQYADRFQMTDEQQMDLLNTFEKYGYDVREQRGRLQEKMKREKA